MLLYGSNKTAVVGKPDTISSIVSALMINSISLSTIPNVEEPRYALAIGLLPFAVKPLL